MKNQSFTNKAAEAFIKLFAFVAACLLLFACIADGLTEDHILAGLLYYFASAGFVAVVLTVISGLVSEKL